jgi:hypothetical protein
MMHPSRRAKAGAVSVSFSGGAIGDVEGEVEGEADVD